MTNYSVFKYKSEKLPVGQVSSMEMGQNRHQRLRAPLSAAMSSAPGDPAPGSVDAKAHISGRVNMSKHGDDYSGRRYLPVCLDPSSEVPNGVLRRFSVPWLFDLFNIS